MKTLSRATLTIAVLALLAAIWQPYGSWWAWLLTGILLLFVGAGLAGTADKHHHPIDEQTLLPEHVAREFVAPSTLERITTDDVDQYKRSYGKPTQKENER